MNKSLVTNGLAALLILIGVLWENPWQDLVLSTGMFAFSGAVTNWLAVYMLFERVPGLYGSGVIPARFEEFKAGIKSLVMEQFFNERNITAFFERSEDAPAMGLTKLVDTIDMNRLFDGLVDVIMASSFGNMVGMIGGRQAIEGLRGSFQDRMSSVLHDLAEDEEIKARLRQHGMESLMTRIEPIVEARLAELTPQLVKEIVQDMIHRHLGWLVVWGGVFGGLIGLLSALFLRQI